MHQSHQSCQAVLLAVRAAERDWRISQCMRAMPQVHDRSASGGFLLRIVQAAVRRLRAMHIAAARWHWRRARLTRIDAGAG